ncbi:MAG: amino acid ABC transporter substrate-binding protein [Acidobacteria bacterium]|nr:amino acid ABC transporter substrate-binding protein [Acidobacteriota bacterium]
MGKKLLLLYLSLPLLVLSSCGGEASTATFNRMSKNQFVTIGSVPFEGPLLHERSQVWVGPDAELGRLVVEKIAEAIEGEDEIEGRWIGMQHGTLATTLANSEVDIAMGVFGITEARKELVAFSEPYYTSQLVLVINPTHRDARPNSLDGLEVGVREGTAVEELVKEKFGGSTIVPFKNLDDAILALRRAEIGAVIDDQYMAAFALDTVPGAGHLEIVPEVVGTVDTAVAVQKKDTRLLGMINEVIAQVKSEDLYSQWLQEEAEAQLAQVQERHPERLERDRQAVLPRRVVIQVSKDNNNDFDIYRMANLTFTLTDEKSGQSYDSSRIDFKGSTGSASVTLQPGSYKLMVRKMNNWSPGIVVVQPSDPERLTIKIRLQRGGQVRMTRS